MIELFTVFSKTGEILYYYNNKDSSTPPLLKSIKPSFNGIANTTVPTTSPSDIHQPTPTTISLINDFLCEYLKSQTSGGPKSIHINKNRIILQQKSNTSSSQDLASISSQSQYIAQNASIVAEWEESSSNDWIALVFYPKVMLDNHGNDMNWTKILLSKALKEFALFYEYESKDEDDEILSGGIHDLDCNQRLFDKTFNTIYKHAESIGRDERTSNSTNESRDQEALAPSRDQVSASTQSKKKKKKGKEDRVWHDGTQKITAKSMAALDRSKSKDSQSIDVALAEARATYLPSDGETPLWEEEEVVLKDDRDEEEDGGWGKSLKGMLSQISGNKILTEQDLKQPLQEMQKLLTSKNVASDIASEICESVSHKLIGKKMSSLRIKNCVRQALEVVIERILTKPKLRNVDLLKEIVTNREGGYFRQKSSKRPYVIVMIGINGVGKSTSLAKIAYYLKSNNIKPLLAACDTFRSGAVEQLNVHAKCLDVELFQKGYAKDPASIAKSAIEYATQEGHDVVLIDTAGRMQNNLPLMKALSSLVVQNNPNLVLFVCEALVGNDGTDQLNMFNKALQSGGHSRQIDGIVLTKFDTVSDKVGASLTMTQVTGAPVVFVGTGQKYNHLKRLSVGQVIKSLFS